MFQGTPTDLAELLDRVKARLVDRIGLSANLIFPTICPEELIAEAPSGNTFVTVKPLRFPGMPGIYAGGPDEAFDGRLLVSVWHRHATDQYLRDANWLTKDPGGVLSAWVRVYLALHAFSPTRSSDANAALTIQPMRCDDGFAIPESKNPAGWKRLDSTWELKFVHRSS